MNIEELAEFLTTADPNDEIALSQAQAHQPEPYLWRIDSQARKIKVLTRLIVNDTLTRLETYQQDTNNPEALRELARQLCAALDPALLMTELYYINLGDAEVKAGYDLAQQHGLLTQDELAAFEQAATRTPGKPFEHATLYDVKIARGTCPIYEQVQKQGSFALITTLKDCPEHNPKLWAKSSRTGKWRKVTNFRGVSAAGTYEAALHADWLNDELRVDDPYQAFEA